MGLHSRHSIEEAAPDWVLATVEADPDPVAAVALADLQVAGEVTVFFGSWCSDSRRELARLWKAIDLAGGDLGFPIRYVGIDRTKTRPEAEVAGREILYVPTFVVEIDGTEVGRIIEHSPNGVERDLLALLEGRASGWLSARTDLPAGAARKVD